MIKLALTDLDDTFVRFGDPATPHAMDSIRAINKAGLHAGPMTGRQQHAMRWMFPNGHDCYATGGFCNGQVLMIEGRVVRRVFIPREPLERVVSYLEENGDDGYLAVYDPFEPDRCALVSRHPNRLFANPPESLFRVFMGHVTGALAPEGYCKVNIQCDCTNERRLQLVGELQRAVPDLTFVSPNPHARVIDVMPALWDKGKGTLALAELLGIAPDEVAVFGDSENDLAMMRAVPNSVAMANAVPVVAKMARWHIGDVRDDATADAFFDIAEAAATGGMPRFMHEGLPE